ncbi:response regulator [Marinilabilia rubra]|uniref:Response regulator n=1 Tax=Marinilabilia rubra TaxID=2162893 RepID=A0A2U2BED7_9BACT|nr:response regulator [Marinilabilia rubra]PWE01422.1 response regulator [Marinilabilia rubra]
MRKVLVVEDDRFISAIFTLFLKDLGFEIVGRCKSGIDALEECDKNKPDIVLMDIHLEGDVDGIEVAETIQRECEVPVIFISSDTSSDVVERAVISNSYGYLVKPITKKELGITMELAYYKHKADLDQRRREQSFRNYISNAPIAITIVQNGIIRYLNNLALDLYKTHYMEDIIGSSMVDFVDDEFVETLEQVLSDDKSEKITPFHLQIKTFHHKPVKVVVHASRINFNGSSALQLVLVEVSDYLAHLDELQKWKEAALTGMGPMLLINNLFEVVDYNPAFREFVCPAFDMRGHSVFTMRPWMNIDRGALANIFNQKSKKPVDISIETTSHFLLCSAYVLNNAEDEPEKILVVLKEAREK